MKPERIFIVRHGQSEGNVNRAIYSVKPDYTVHLTEVGRKQAHDAGKELKSIIGDESVKFYVSPFWRTRETSLEIMKWFDDDWTNNVYEDPRLREQEWTGKLPPNGFDMSMEKERDIYGHFYYRFKGGESCADVFDRVGGFMTTLFRDFEKKDFPDNVVIVTHGMAMRLLLMRWFHYTVEFFETIKNPKNCAWYMFRQLNNGKYLLETDLPKHVVRHSHQFPKYTPLPLD